MSTRANRWPTSKIPRQPVKPRRATDFAAAYGGVHPRGLPLVSDISKLMKPRRTK